MLGHWENFPRQIHLSTTFAMASSKEATQQKLVKTFHELNGRNFSFEEVGSPAVPGGIVIFMFGIADADGFKFLNDAQTQRLEDALDTEPLETIDWLLAIRYYRNTQPKRKPLKFDYYALRLTFGEKDTFQVLVSHERGPRYVNPDDLVTFLAKKVNEASKRKALRRIDG